MPDTSGLIFQVKSHGAPTLVVSLEMANRSLGYIRRNIKSKSKDVREAA